MSERIPTYNFDSFNKEEAEERVRWILDNIVVKTLKEYGFNPTIKQREIVNPDSWGLVAEFETKDSDDEEYNNLLFCNGFDYNKPTKQYCLQIYHEQFEYSCWRSELFIPVSEEDIEKYKKYCEEHPDSYLHKVEREVVK